MGQSIFGHEQMQIAIQTINELSKEVKKPSWDWDPPPVDKNLVQSIEESAAKDLINAYTITDKIERQASIFNIKDAICTSYAEKDEPEWSVEQISSALSKLE